MNSIKYPKCNLTNWGPRSIARAVRMFRRFDGFLLAPVGLVLGIAALVRSRKRPTEYGGQWFAIAGTIHSGLRVLFFPIIATIAIADVHDVLVDVGHDPYYG